MFKNTIPVGNDHVFDAIQVLGGEPMGSRASRWAREYVAVVLRDPQFAIVPDFDVNVEAIEMERFLRHRTAERGDDVDQDRECNAKPCHGSHR